MHQHHRSMRPVWARVLPRAAAGLLATIALFLAGCGDPSASPTNPSISNSGNAKVVTPKDKDQSKDHSKGEDKDHGQDNGCEGNGHGGSVPSSAASNFALLANLAVTATDATIAGDVGTLVVGPLPPDPLSPVTLTNSTVAGTIHVGDAVAVQAYNNFLSTYDAIAATPCSSVLTTLDGLTLAPGVYCFDAAATSTGGVLTLDGPANGTWIFKVGTLGTGALTGTGFSVVMAGGGQACNVTWWVSQAATMTDSNFLGNILAGAAITLTRGTFTGNAWSKAAVTATGPIAVAGCAGTVGNGGNGCGEGHDQDKFNQGVGNGPDGGDPGHSDHHHSSNDEDGGTPGNPGRKGSH